MSSESKAHAAGYGRWPWSWPVQVPAEIDTGDGRTVTLHSRGTIYDFAAHVGKGYEGELVRPSEDGPIELEYKVGRRYLRSQLRSGTWKLIR